MKRTRRVVQLVFLSVVLIGVFVAGAHCERWCPFGGVEAAYTYFTEGNMVCSLASSNFFILAGVFLATLVLRRAFCSHVCPIAAVSELLHGLGRWLRIPRLRIPEKTDHGLAFGKYLVLGAILFATWRTGELLFRGFDPCYALISRHGPDITVWAYVVAGTIALASLAVTLPFCRWFCPFAAVLNPISRFALTRVKRDVAACHDCGACAKACPAQIPVDQLAEVSAAGCTSCLSCVDSCPQRHSSSPALHWGPVLPRTQKWPQAALVGLLVICLAGAAYASHLFPTPSFVKGRGEFPTDVSKVILAVENVDCRGKANLLYHLLTPTDSFEVPGPLRIEAWPGPGPSDVHVTFDPAVTDEETIKRAIVEPYYDVSSQSWRISPFVIEGYEPWMFQRQIQWSAGP